MVALFDAYTPIETGGPVASQEEKDTVLASLLPPEYRALLRTISASESGGVATNKHDPYRYMYNGRYAPDFIDHPRQAFPIVSSSPNAGQSTSAAGGYQFLAKTQPGGKDRSWDEAKKALNLPDFSPESQDRAAIWHAENTYKAKTHGRDLLTDIKAAQGKPEQLSNIGRALSGWWTSLPGGIERNSATGSFGTRFANELGAGDTYGGPALYGPNAPISNAIPSNVRETSAPSDSTKQLRNPNMPSGMPAIMGGGGGENDMPSLLRGGLSALQDPETMAYLQMIVKGLNPWSSLDPNKALAQAQTLAQHRADAARAQSNANRQFDLEKQKFDLTASQAGLTDVAKHLIQMGETPGTEAYRRQYKDLMTDNKGKFQKIGTDSMGREIFGFVNPLTQQVYDLEGKQLKPGTINSGAMDNPQGLQGEDYLKSIGEPGVANTVRSILEGRMAPPTSFAASKPYWQTILQHAANAEPGFDLTKWQGRVGTAKDFASGQAAKNVTSLNTVIGHLDTLAEKADALSNTRFPAVNEVTNWMSSQVGRPEVKQFIQARNAVADEMAKVFRSTGMSQADIRQWQDTLSAADSPAQLRGNIKQGIELMNSRVDALKEQYRRGAGKEPPELLSQKSLEILKKLDAWSGGETPAKIQQPAEVPSRAELEAEARRRRLMP